MGHVQQGWAGDMPGPGCLALWGGRAPPSHGQEGLSGTGGFLEPRKCPQTLQGLAAQPLLPLMAFK